MLSFLTTVMPVLVFLLAIALVAEVCDRVGLFDVAGHALLRLAGGRVALLWLGLVILCVITTSVLSLDTTAVLVAPVAIAMAKRARRDPVPFAVTAVWLANTASLLLPVSNLTNLLSAVHGSPLKGQFTLSTWLPALTSVVVTVVMIMVFYPKVARGRFRLPAAPSTRDRGLLWLSGAVCAVLAVVFALGVQPALPTVGAAVVLVVAYARKHPHAWKRLSVPWKMALAVLALFVVVRIAGPLGLNDLLAGALGQGDTLLDQLRVAAVGALGSNLINNLPAFLALQPGVMDQSSRSVALLIGSNTGSVVTPWGSLATLLWLWRCRASGVGVNLGMHTLRSAGLAVVVVPTTTMASALAQGLLHGLRH